MPSGLPDRVLRCPRCGYNLRGEADTWQTSWPISGLCTECGLAFDWRELLSMKIRMARWCVEYAGSPSRLIVNSAKTLLRSLWPFYFWKQIELADDIRPRRLVAYVALVTVLLYAIMAGSHGIIVWHQVALLNQNAMAAGTAPVVLSWSDYVAVCLLPWLDVTVASWGATSAYLWATHGQTIVVGLGLMLAMHASCAAAYVVLPVSRRVARVRWIHIVRIAMYGAVPIMLIAALEMIGTVLITVGNETWPLLALNVVVVVMIATGFAFFPVLFIWWSTASGRYVRMQYPWAIGASVTVLGVLFSLTALVWFGSLFS